MIIITTIWYDKKNQISIIIGTRRGGVNKMLLTLDESKDRGYLYKQIYEAIIANILARKIRPNEKLPSKRELATQLKVSVNTITNAYGQLLAEGYIYTIERSGYFVEDITPFTYKNQEKKTVIPSDLKEETKEKLRWSSLSHMTADTSMFPFKEWIKSQQQAIDHHKEELAVIAHPQGPYTVRDTISRKIALSRGVVCEPEQIVISAGTQPLIQQLMELQHKSTIVAIEDPGYSRFYTLLKRMSVNVQPIQLDENGVDIKKVEASKANVLIVTPSHQFPTGTIMPISRRIELLNWAIQENDRFIIEDDYDSDFKYKTDSIPSLQSLDRNDRVIYTGTFSKSLLPGLRISYMVLPINILREYRKQYADLMQYSNTIGLYTLHYFIKSGAHARHIKRMNHHYEEKRNYLIEQLTEQFKADIIIKDIPAGLHFLAKFKTNRSYEDIEYRAKQEELEVYSMRRFMLKIQYKEPNFIELVIGFANIRIKEIPESIRKLHRILN